ncbi:MAG: signal peptidase II [Burkholderiaceae bacterium]
MASPKSRSRMSAARWMMVAALLIGLDQLSNLIIVHSYALGQQSVLTSWFNVVRVHNTGAAFSFLSDAGGWQRWFFVGLGVLAVAVLAFLMIRHAGQVLFSLAATLIISGAIGNTIDRLSYGYVVDFIDWHYAGWHWPAFNFADSFIMVGAGLFILDEIRRVRRG